MGLAIKVYGVSFKDNNIGQVTEALPIESISLGCATGIYNNENTAICVATIIPDNTLDKNVMWSIIDGSSYATIDQNGKITVLSSANGTNGNNITIKCVSRINIEVFTTLTVKVKYSNNLETTGIYGYYIKENGYWTKGRTSDACFCDTTFRELDEGIKSFKYLKIKSSSDYSLSGYVYCTIYDADFKPLGTIGVNGNITAPNGQNFNLTNYVDKAKYVSFSMSIYGASSSPLMDALKNAYENATFTYIKSTDTNTSFTNFISID